MSSRHAPCKAQRASLLRRWGLFGNEAQESAVGVTNLGRSIFRTSAEAKRLGGVFRSADGRLREANGNFVKGREALEGFGRAAVGASGGTQTFTRSLGGLGNILGGLGIAVVGAQLTRFATASVSAAARLEGFERGLRLIEGTNAPQRLEELIEVANLPGLNLTDLIQYSNRLRTLGLTAAETDTLLISTGQAITAFGGTAHTAAEATEQIIQAISSGTVSLQDFRSIAQRVPGFYQAIADVHGVTANIAGLRTAVENAGGSIKDALIPVMEELSQRFAAPPPESYAASIDELQNSFFLFQAILGEQVLPAVSATARGLATLFDRIREAIEGTDEFVQASMRFSTALGQAEGDTDATSASVQAYIERLTELRTEQEQLRDDGPWYRYRGDADENIERLTADIELFTAALEGVPGSQDRVRAAFEQARTEYQNQSRVIVNLTTELDNNRLSAGENNDAYEAAQATLVTTRTRFEELLGTMRALGLIDLPEQTEAASEATAKLGESAGEATRVYRNFTVDIDNATDTVERWQQALEAATTEAGATEAYDNLTRANQSLNAVQLANIQQREDSAEKGMALYALERESLQSVQAAEETRAKVFEQLTNVRIQAAVEARDLEVSGFQAAAKSGASYAEQLEQIGSVSQRRAFVDLIDSLQDQGLSFDEARTGASKYLPLLTEVVQATTAADRMFGDFTSTITRGANESADAVLNLVGAVEQLGTSIANRLPDTAGSLERSLLNEQRYFQQNPIGRTLDDIQGEAGEQGRNFVNRLFVRQDREDERAALEAQRESIQLYNDLSAATVDFTFSLIDLQEEINLADRGFQDFLGTFGRLATGDFTALLDIPIQLLNISREAATERQQGAQERSARYEEQFGDFSRFGRNFGTVSDILGIPESPELSDSFFFNPAREFENVIAQSTADFSEGIKNALLSSVINLERDIRPEDIAEIFQSGIDRLGESLALSQFNLNFDEQLGRDTADAYNALISDTTAFYQAQIDVINLVRQTTGNLSFGDPEALARASQAATNQARLQLDSGPQNAQQFLARQRDARATAERTGTDRQFTEDIARAQYGDAAYDAEVAAAGELTEAEAIAPVISSINEAIGLINASILSVETQIDQSNDPAEIADLLLRVPALIAEKYAMLRQALEERLNAGEISVDVYNASLSELTSGESAEIERHSDATLANVVRMIDEDIGLIDASITDIETQIAGLSDPEAIAELLSQIPGLITEKYQLLRDALDAKYGAGEISVDVYNTSLSVINSREASDIERQSDAVLAQTLQGIDEDVELIAANIGALQLAVENTDDPDAIAGLLDAIKLLVMDKYRRLRERLDALLANEEISQTAFDAATTAIGTAESRELSALNAQGLNEISEATQAQVSFINGAIFNLRTTLELTDDPAEVQQILEAIRVLIGARFDILRAELEAIRETLKPEEYQQAFEGLNLAERLAFQNLDTEVFSAISAAAQMQVDFINGGINNLRLSLQLTEDPAELEQILNSIKVLVGARFDILIQELKDIEESLDPEIFKQALEGLELGKLVGIQNIDREITTATTPVAPRASVSRVTTEIRNIALETAERQTHFIDGTLDNLRTSLALTGDPAEIQQILDAIKTLTSSRFDSLRAELEAIRNTLSSEEYEQALTGLNLGETLALQNLDTEKFAAISAEAQSQVDFVNGGIENLRLSIQLTDDPTQRQAILDAIKILLMQRFTILRTELENIRESLKPEDYQQALTGLNLGEQLALNNIDTEKFGIISAAAQEQVGFINTDIENLRTAFELTDDPAERQAILDTIKILTQARFDILREELESIRENLSPEDYQQALKGLNLGETLALENIDTEKFGVISEAAQKQVDFVNGAISNLELAFQLTDDPAEAQQILDAIKVLVAKRFENPYPRIESDRRFL